MNGEGWEQLGSYVIKQVQEAYENGEMRKTDDCINDMARDGLYEADVEKVIGTAKTIEKAMPATSSRASHPDNTHYVIYGESITGVKVYCKICSNYHEATGEFICWALTSFCISN